MGANSSLTILWTSIPPVLLQLIVTLVHAVQLNYVVCRASLIWCKEGKGKDSQKLTWLIVWKTMAPSVQCHSRKLHSSKSHHDKQAFAFYFHPALVCPVRDVKDAGIPEVHTHSKRKVQDPRADTLVALFKQLRQGNDSGSSSKKVAATSSQANIQQRTAQQPHTCAVACHRLWACVTCATNHVTITPSFCCAN